MYHHITIHNHNTGSESQRRPNRDKGFRNHEVCPQKTVIFSYQSFVRFVLVHQTLCYTSVPQAWTKEARFLATFCTRSGLAGGGGILQVRNSSSIPFKEKNLEHQGLLPQNVAIPLKPNSDRITLFIFVLSH